MAHLETPKLSGLATLTLDGLPIYIKAKRMLIEARDAARGKSLILNFPSLEIVQAMQDILTADGFLVTRDPKYSLQLTVDWTNLTPLRRECSQCIVGTSGFERYDGICSICTDKMRKIQNSRTPGRKRNAGMFLHKLKDLVACYGVEYNTPELREIFEQCCQAALKMEDSTLYKGPISDVMQTIRMLNAEGCSAFESDDGLVVMF